MRGPFFTFLRGAQGVALILLRLSVAFTLFVSIDGHSPYALISASAGSTWTMILLGCLAAMVCSGFMTGVTTVVCAILQAAVVIAGGIDAGALYLPISNAMVLALLGPGEYSVDAHLFGPRVLMTTSHGTKDGQAVREPKR